MGYTKTSKTSQDFLEEAREAFVSVASTIQDASELLTLEALCELVELAEYGVLKLNAAINITVDAESLG